jgi:beta-galactosidase
MWALPPALPSWTWPGQEGKPLTVDVYSRCDAVRLYLDDKLIGEQPTTEAEEFRASFAVPYSPGTLRAVGVQGGNEVEEFKLATAGPAGGLRLTPERTEIAADGQDLAFIKVEIVDAEGNLNTSVDEPVDYRLEGPGSIIAIGSGDLTSREPYQANPRHTYDGRALVVVRSSREPGTLKLTATTPGLKEATVDIESRGPE